MWPASIKDNCLFSNRAGLGTSPFLRDKQHETHKARKSTFRFGKISSLVWIGPKLSKIQLFITLKMYKTLRPDGCISLNIDPINTKLENVSNLIVLFLTMWVSCSLSHITRIRPSTSRFEIRQWLGWRGGKKGEKIGERKIPPFPFCALPLFLRLSRRLTIGSLSSDVVGRRTSTGS